jgi:hypothetical protein
MHNTKRMRFTSHDTLRIYCFYKPPSGCGGFPLPPATRAARPLLRSLRYGNVFAVVSGIKS